MLRRHRRSGVLVGVVVRRKVGKIRYDLDNGMDDLNTK